MLIYGLFLMSASMLIGKMIGTSLGSLIGVSADVGGVGFAMLILVLLSNKLISKEMLSSAAQSGIKFWSAMYIPVVVAMCLNQNVFGAVMGGSIAIISGILAVVLSLALMRPLTNLSNKRSLAEGVA